ncbi:MAG: RluA family pseudouridine synthase [Chromatiaceae bacterium]|jgi:23S rRNA pseudouridine955/2504/2580 synthase|nr:RluA family pseudouridine synthase [Chromatiaceae bacterium]
MSNAAPAAGPTSPAQPGPGGAEYLRVDGELAGQRIDNFLLARVKGVPRSHLYRVLRRGEVRVNKGRVRPSYRLQEGDLVRIPPLRTGEEPPQAQPSRGELARLEQAILYEDERLIAIDKPAGLAVHGGSGLSHGVIEAMRRLRPDLTDLELVHRLDRETSGCLLLAKRRSALRSLHAALRASEVDKRYLALLVGRLPRREVAVDAPLRKNLLRGGERVVRVDPAEGKPARTVFRRLRQIGDLTLVEAQLLTGRTHQIRVHAAHLGTPIAGDEKYGDAAANRRLRAEGLKRLFLHAAALTVPREGKPLRIEAPLPAELAAVLASLDGTAA